MLSSALGSQHSKNSRIEAATGTPKLLVELFAGKTRRMQLWTGRYSANTQLQQGPYIWINVPWALKKINW